jgi:hypothetical protein
MTEAKMNREEILKAAADIVTRDREDTYGKPEDNFALIAQLWYCYKGVPFAAEDVALMMALLKIARISTGKYKADNYIDLAGYAACAGEIAAQETDGGTA